MHDHDHPGQEHVPVPPSRRSAMRRLAFVLVLTVAYTVAEVVGGVLTGSLALLADAGHMMTDNVALALALLAAWFAARPPDSGRTYGYRRAEILAALANGVGLLIVCALITWEALGRFGAPHAVKAGPMAAVAGGGLLVNLVAALLLHGHRDGMNVRAAFLHVVGDLLGSLGALAAAALVAWQGWLWADPAASLAIGALLAWNAWKLSGQAVRVLMESVPPDLDTRRVHRCLRETPGVAGVHDLHLWSLAEGTPLLTAHLVVDHSVAGPRVLKDALDRLAAQFGITHATLQIEPPDHNIVHGPGLEPAAASRNGSRDPKLD